MRIGFSILLIVFSGMLFAQKAKVGIVNRDSVMNTMPGHNGLNDTVKNYQIKREKVLTEMKFQLERKLREIDSMKEKDSPLIHSLRMTQAQQMESTLYHYENLSEEEYEMLSLRLLGYTHAVEQAEIKMVEKYHCAIESEFKNDNREPIYLTNEVIALVKENKAAQAEKKQIGYVSKDSLLSSIYPEYAKLSAQFKKEVELLADTADIFDRNIQEKMRAMDSLAGKAKLQERIKQQREIDSLTAAYEKHLEVSGNRIVARDSIACSTYNQKYDKAWEEMMNNSDIFYIYDMEDAKLAWKDEEVVFVNLNKEFAAKLE